MLKDLLVSKNIPDWNPDFHPTTVVQSEDITQTFDIYSNSNLPEVIEPNSPESSEKSVLDAANQLIENSKILPFDRKFVNDPLTAGPALTLMILGEVKRQKDQVETTKSAISKLPKDNLLSTFRITQVLTLDRVLKETHKYLTKLDNDKEKKKVTEEEKTLSDNAAKELLTSGYFGLLTGFPPIPKEYFTEESLITAGKLELLAEKQTKLFSKYSSALPPAQLSISYLGLEKIVKQSIESLREINSYAAQDRLETFTRIKYINQLKNCLGMIDNPYEDNSNNDWEQYALY